MTLRDKIGKEIKLIRTSLGLNQTEFATKFNYKKPDSLKPINQNALSRWENGHSPVAADIMDFMRIMGAN